jgi:hypothetical protein
MGRRERGEERGGGGGGEVGINNIPGGKRRFSRLFLDMNFVQFSENVLTKIVLLVSNLSVQQKLKPKQTVSVH